MNYVKLDDTTPYLRVYRLMLEHNLLSFTISLLIGLLIGIERERSHVKGVQSIGVQTFTLFALTGTLAAVLNQPTLTATLSAFVFGIISLNYLRTTIRLKKNIDIGITTEISAGITFCLGYMVQSAPLIAILVSTVILLVLLERKRLHAVARKKFKPQEMEAAIILIVFALGILPILPNKTIDPWGLFNPRNFGMLIATIGTIQFGGYIAIHLFGERFGMAFMGFIGGLVSSTAVFATLPGTLRSHPKFIFATIASAILATVAMLVEIMVIIFVASQTLFVHILRPMITMISLGIIFVIFLLYFQKFKKHAPLTLSTPLNLLSILRISIFLGVTLVLIAIAKRFVGTEGMLLITFLGGLFEIHGITLATGLLYLQKQLSINVACLILYVAILASFISKFFLLWSLSPHRFALQTSLFLLVMVASGGTMYWLTL
jgi:uncharacterized membrane protein (DUF4010 family)